MLKRKIDIKTNMEAKKEQINLNTKVRRRINNLLINKIVPNKNLILILVMNYKQIEIKGKIKIEESQRTT